MGALRIILGCIAAAVFYGILHDQVTARICLEYFTVFHPPVFPTQSPTLLGIGWGIIATWWVGAFLGILLAIAARFGKRPKINFSQLAPMVGRLLFVMAVCAGISGLVGFYVGMGSLPPWVSEQLPPSLYRRFLFDWWAHNASYASGFLGGLVLCVIVWKKRSGAPLPS